MTAVEPPSGCGPGCAEAHTYRGNECALSCREIGGGVADPSWTVPCSACGTMIGFPCYWPDGAPCGVAHGQRWDAYDRAQKTAVRTTPDHPADAVDTPAAQIAYRIRAELVCCHIYGRVNDAHELTIRQAMDSRDWHDLCYWGEAAARIAEGRVDESECRDAEGCHRVVPCDPGCAVMARALHAALANAPGRQPVDLVPILADLARTLHAAIVTGRPIGPAVAPELGGGG